MVVSNTSPILNLARIGQLDLLRAVYGEVVIPDLGTLAEAKRLGLVTAVRPLLDALIHQAGFWVKPSLRDHVLSQVRELP